MGKGENRIKSRKEANTSCLNLRTDLVKPRSKMRPPPGPDEAACRAPARPGSKFKGGRGREGGGGGWLDVESPQGWGAKSGESPESRGDACSSSLHPPREGDTGFQRRLH